MMGHLWPEIAKTFHSRASRGVAIQREWKASKTKIARILTRMSELSRVRHVGPVSLQSPVDWQCQDRSSLRLISLGKVPRIILWQ
jgi:hypothetical protein